MNEACSGEQRGNTKARSLIIHVYLLQVSIRIVDFQTWPIHPMDDFAQRHDVETEEKGFDVGAALVWRNPSTTNL